MPRRFAPRNDMQKLAGWLRLPGALPEYCRKTVLSSRSAPAFSMSLRTSAHTGVAIRVPAEKLCKLAILRANLWRFSDSPKVLLFVLLYCEENGLPRRSAPRNDMLKHGRCPQGNDVAPGEFVTLFGFAQSTASRHALPQGERIATSLRSSQ